MSPSNTLQSKTLPRNFLFHYTDEEVPTTTAREETQVEAQTLDTSDLLEPPAHAQPQSRLRIRRRRPVSYERMGDGASPILPTVELPELMNESPALPTENLTSCVQQGRLAPFYSASLGRSISPPKTPLGQTTTVFDPSTPVNDWTHAKIHLGTSISRPTSACSVTSDSSASSLSSSDTFPSHGDSCTSPESDNTDPFIFSEVKGRPLLNSLPMFVDRLNAGKQLKPLGKVKWTLDMDDHLWMTYMIYLADPTVTPFKILPGTVPPLGVCHRVAREAKRSWKGSRLPLDSIAEHQSPQRSGLAAAPSLRREASAPVETLRDIISADLPRPGTVLRSHSTSGIPRKHVSRWPRSESSTRKRLRELCKRKFTLPPHYQRLMHTRSPSPFESSSSRAWTRSSRYTPPPASDRHSVFSTRDLNFTLATSTAASMQPNGPLAQLASEDLTPQQHGQGWSDRPASRAHAHQKSQSLQLGLGLGSSPANDFRELAPPFQAAPQCRNWLSGWEPVAPLAAGEENAPSNQPKLDPPLEIHAPRPLSGSMKRRAQYPLGEDMVSDDADTRRNFLEGLFSDPHVNGKRRVRSRGFSMGAMSHGPPPCPLAELFTPPSANDQQRSGSGQLEDSFLPPPALEHARRLGSPFAPTTSNVGLSNTFPRSLFPQGLDSIAALERQEHVWSDGSSSSTVRHL